MILGKYTNIVALWLHHTTQIHIDLRAILCMSAKCCSTCHCLLPLFQPDPEHTDESLHGRTAVTALSTLTVGSCSPVFCAVVVLHNATHQSRQGSSDGTLSPTSKVNIWPSLSSEHTKQKERHVQIGTGNNLTQCNCPSHLPSHLPLPPTLQFSLPPTHILELESL